MKPTLPGGLYGMLDTGFGDPVAQARLLCGAGCRVMQLRAKGWPAEAVEDAARAIQPLAASAGALLLINDHPEIAARVGAAGAHIGQEDGAVEAARAALGPDRLLGLSTHTDAQVSAAQSVADYIGFGPVFGTQTKATGYAPRGVDALARAAERSAIPVVAIGGITEDNVAAVVGSGARCWAVISAVWRSQSPLKAARWFARLE